MLAVDPSIQGRGVGRALVMACLDRARDRGRPGVFLHSTPEMVVAHHLYDSLGFERALDRDWRLDGETWFLAFALTFKGGPVPVKKQAGQR
jgi:ribosomal protein S18 acetylase RimI-like enzyme